MIEVLFGVKGKGAECVFGCAAHNAFAKMAHTQMEEEKIVRKRREREVFQNRVICFLFCGGRVF